MNGPTGQWILKIILPGLRIQSEILICSGSWFHRLFGSGFFEFAREEVRIVDLNNRQKYVVSGSDCKFFCHRRDFLHVTHQ